MKSKNFLLITIILILVSHFYHEDYDVHKYWGPLIASIFTGFGALVAFIVGVVMMFREKNE